MTSILPRAWAGIVGAVAGAAVAVVVQVVGQMTKTLGIEQLAWVLLVCAGSGFVLGVILGPRQGEPRAPSR